jgi:hypothetical protein
MGPFKDGWTKSQVEEVISNNKVEELLYVPIVVGMDPPDFEWANSVCVRLARHSDSEVHSNAILGIGHLARVCRKISDEALVALRHAARHPDRSVYLTANDTRGEIESMLKIKISLET